MSNPVSQNSPSEEYSPAPSGPAGRRAFGPAGVRAVTALTFLTSLLLGGMIVLIVENNRLQGRQKQADGITARFAYTIQDRLNRSLSATYALAALIRQGNGRIDHFEQLVSEMLPFYGGISSLQLAPGGVIRQIVPLAGNEKAIGHNLLEDTKRNKEALLALQTRKLTLAGPFELVQGGRAVVGRLPVYLRRPDGTDYFWGFTAVLIRIPEFITAINLQAIVEAGYEYQLSRTPPDTGQPDIFARSTGRALRSPVHHAIEVPNGTWVLSLEPRAGWYALPPLIGECALVLFISTLLAGMLHTLCRQPLLLQRMVDERTRQLSESNQRLTTALEERERAVEYRLRLEAQMQHAQKLESLGVLAGGIAHDFNNILLAILGHAELAIMRLSPVSPARDNLLKIEQAAQRASDLARQMLAYSGKGHFVVEPLDLGEVITEMSHMLEVSISKKVILRFNLAKNLPPVEVDATQVRQVLMNLVINASEAIGDASGVIAISTGAMQCDRNYLSETWLDERLPEGLYVYVEVADTGCGMERETMARIFDPFFTTKFTGRGLGMAAVLGIVRGHHGAIKVYSEPGRGTTFKMLLPAGQGHAAELRAIADDRDIWHGSGTVLLVDDEETIRALGSEMLEFLGFTVLTASDGRQALEMFTSRAAGITAVILDLTMPHMDGEETFRELRRLRSDVCVIMSSGYNEQEVSQRFIGKGLAGFIQKPYRLSELSAVLRRALQPGTHQG